MTSVYDGPPRCYNCHRRNLAVPVMNGLITCLFHGRSKKPDAVCKDWKKIDFTPGRLGTGRASRPVEGVQSGNLHE